MRATPCAVNTRLHFFSGGGVMVIGTAVKVIGTSPALVLSLLLPAFCMLLSSRLFKP
jgi:hypothetical protein